MPTSGLFLSMTRGMTGVISRIKLPAVVDPSSVSLVPRTAKSYSIWTVRNRPQQRHKQALRFGSAPPFTFLCIPLHGSSACHSLNPLQSRRRVFPTNSKRLHHDNNFTIGNKIRAVRIRQLPRANRIGQHFRASRIRNRQKPLEPSESKNDVGRRAVEAPRPLRSV